MWTFSGEFMEVSQKLGVSASILDREAGKRVHGEMLAKYGLNKGAWPLWDGPSDNPSLQAVDAWEEMGEFLADSPCLLFWNPTSDRNVLRFEIGRDLVKVLEEAPTNEFYVTDDARSYLLCFNHHQYLIAAGRAAPWLREVKKRRASPKKA
jgi:hypothetical protein